MIRAVQAGNAAQGSRADERLSAIQTAAPFGPADDVEFGTSPD